MLKWAGFIAGVSLPAPQYVAIHDPLPIARWMSAVLDLGKIPHLMAYSSCVVRVCEAALDNGINLRGAQFTMHGESITAARVAAVQRVGGQATCFYATAESGGLAVGCMAPEAPDNVHLMHDRCAVIQPGLNAKVELPADALLFSTILPDSRLILLNVSLGDRATVNERDCGCPLRSLGWTTHLHSIRSFEKLTAGGVTFLDSDLIHVLEEHLPKHFGGGPTDYQLVDEETNEGMPRVRLLAHPRLGSLDGAEVKRIFLDAIGNGTGVGHLMMSMWRDAGLPIVERRVPRITASGKILHVHREQNNGRVQLGTASEPDAVAG